MHQVKLARRTSISRRRMLYTLSIVGAGVALAGQFPAYAMQAGRTASDTPALLPLNRFPRMVKSKTIYTFTEEKSRSLAAKRLDLDGAALPQTVAEVLRLPQRNGVPEFRILRPLPDRKYPLRYALPYMVETDPRVHAIVYRLTAEPLLSRPPRDTNKAILYVSHKSADEELRTERLIRDLIEADPGAASYTCDVRGVGDSEPQTTSLSDRGESALPPGVLNSFDLPDGYRELKKKNVRLLEPWGANPT